MIELTTEERLKIHLLLHYPDVKLKNITLCKKPGFLQNTINNSLIDIRGASYGPNNPLRLWDELHSYFTQHIQILKRKNGQPTLILWNGMVFHLDQTRTYQERSYPRLRERKRIGEVK